MILRSIDAIVHNHDTMLLGEDGEDATTNWETKPSLEAKPFRENLGGTPTRGWV